MSKETKKEIPVNKKLLSIIDEYLVDLECLREMHSSVVPVLKEKDKERRDTVNEILKGAIVKEDTQSVKSEAENISESNSDKLEKEGKDVDLNEEPEDEEHTSKKTISLKLKSGELDFLISNFGKIKRAEKLFERQLIVTLVSRFDEFLGQVLRLVLEQNPSWLVSSEKTITYKELIDLKSIDKAIEGVIQKEVENLLRGSHEDQISYIDEKLKIGISEHFCKLPEFLEVAERRNLFVHTGGEVSNQYIDKCNCFGSKGKVVKCGDSLCSDSDYFHNAFIVYFEIGLRIGQASYRRLFHNELEVADRSLNNLAIKFMNAGEYNLSEVITEFDLAIPEKLRSEETEYLYFAKINRAISHKFQDKDFEDGLKGVPWNVFHPKYSLCLHVLREEYEDASKLMLSEEIKTSVGKEGLRTWPVFRIFRESDEFKEAYKDIFGDEYIPNFEKDAQLKTEQENKALTEES